MTVKALAREHGPEHDRDTDGDRDQRQAHAVPDALLARGRVRHGRVRLEWRCGLAQHVVLACEHGWLWLLDPRFVGHLLVVSYCEAVQTIAYDRAL